MSETVFIARDVREIVLSEIFFCWCVNKYKLLTEG